MSDSTPEKKLTPKQQRFVEHYLEDLNATQAAIKAGYSKECAQEIGSQNLSKVMISQAIQAAFDARSKRTLVTADYVIKGLMENHQRAMQIVPVMDEEGNIIGEFRYEGAVANKALELLGKHLQMFTDKTISDVSTEHTVRFVD